MLCGGESGHVGPSFGDDDVGGVPTDAGNGADQVAEAAKGLDHHLDSIGELLDGRGVLVDQVQVHAGQKRVMGGEPTVESLGQLRDFHPHPVLGKLGHGRRITLAGNQGFQHRPR